MPTIDFLLDRLREKPPGELARDGPGYLLTQVRRRAVRARYRVEFAVRSNAAPVDRDRLVATLGDAERILVLCHGNVCRSPFAAAHLDRTLADGDLDREVRSAGLHATEGNASPRLARETASAYGVDLSDHRARPATRSDVADADVVFLMDGLNYHSYRRQFPAATDRAFFLSTAVPDATGLEIPDPYRNGRGAFERAFADVVAAVEEVVAILEDTENGR